jgi:hypothetical protein
LAALLFVGWMLVAFGLAAVLAANARRLALLLGAGVVSSAALLLISYRSAADDRDAGGEFAIWAGVLMLVTWVVGVSPAQPSASYGTPHASITEASRALPRTSRRRTCGEVGRGRAVSCAARGVAQPG